MRAVSVYLGPRSPGQFSVDDGNGFGGGVDFPRKEEGFRFGRARSELQ